MRIASLTLRNFRKFKEKSLSFSPSFNVLIGDNGSGKTTILDALSVAVGSFFLGIDNQPTRSIRTEEIRLRAFEVNGEMTREYASEVRVEASGNLDGRSVQWARTLRGEGRHTSYGEAKALMKLAHAVQQSARESPNSILPLIAYHATGRMWLRKSQTKPRPGLSDSRFRGYDDCLDIQTNEHRLHEWWKARELAALQRDEPPAGLRGVKDAVAKTMGPWNDVWYDLVFKELVAKNEERCILPTRMLSDGQRNVLALVTDIAYRAAVLNPALGAVAYQETPGVVLIDEIDLHLHPHWQRRIVEDLRATFPKLQFIATTHSPLIVQSLRPGELMNLNPGTPHEYANRSPEDIYENVMGEAMPQRSERSKQMIAAAEKYYALLKESLNADDSRLPHLKSELDRLIEPYADNEAYIALLRSERLASGLDRSRS